MKQKTQENKVFCEYTRDGSTVSFHGMLNLLVNSE